MGKSVWRSILEWKGYKQIQLSEKWGYFLFAFFLPFPIPVSRVFIFIFLISRLHRLKSIRLEQVRKKIKTGDYLLLVFFGLYALSLFYSFHFSIGAKQLEKIFPFVLLPIVVAHDQIERADFNRIVKAFLAGLSVMCIFLILKAFYHSLYMENGGMAFDPRVLRDPRITYIHSVNWGGNYFFSDNLVDTMHPSYLGMYLVFALGCVLYLYQHRMLSLSLTILYSSLFISILFLSSARASHISLVIAVLLLFVGNNKYSKKAKTSVLVILIVTSGLFLFLNPRWVEFSGLTEMINGKIEYRGSVPERLMSWDASLRLISNNFFFGYGLGDVQTELNQMYLKLNYTRPFNESHNAHNQFLQTQLSVGVVGTVIFLLIYYKLFTIYRGTNHSLVLIFLIITCIHFIFESMLERYAGVVFFAFFYSLFVSHLTKTQKYDRDN